MSTDLPVKTRFALGVGQLLRRIRIRGIPRIYWWTGRWVIGSGVRCVPTVTGVNICTDVSQYIGCMMVYGRFAPEVITLLSELLSTGDSALDIGAHLGYITSHMARIVGPTGHVYSFEPDPNARALLERTVAANDARSVEILDVAASDQDGELVFHLSPTLGWSTAVANTHYSDLEAIEVPRRRVDSLVQDGRFARPIRVIKIDVEGYEHTAFDGMQGLLAEDRPFVIMEVAPVLLEAQGLSSVDVLAKIAKHDYRFYRLSEQKGLLRGGSYQLEPVDPLVELPFSDVVCVPQEASVPPNRSSCS